MTTGIAITVIDGPRSVIQTTDDLPICETETRITTTGGDLPRITATTDEGHQGHRSIGNTTGCPRVATEAAGITATGADQGPGRRAVLIMS